MDGLNETTTERRARGRPRGWDDKTEQNTIKSLDRAMQVLAYLSERSGLALSTLASELNQSPATVYRILVTLEARKMVEFDAAEQLWHIGSGAFVIGARYLRRTSLVERARPILRRLMETTGETANLGIMRGPDVLFVSQIETHENIRAFFPPGTLSPLHASGIGKALLAHMEDAQLDTFLGEASYQRFTEHTLVTEESVREELAAIRMRGFSVDMDEKSIGMRCVAAPVFDYNREAVAGVSVSGPDIRLSARRISEIGLAVMQAANELTEAMGGTPGANQA